MNNKTPKPIDYDILNDDTKEFFDRRKVIEKKESAIPNMSEIVNKALGSIEQQNRDLMEKLFLCSGIEMLLEKWIGLLKERKGCIVLAEMEVFLDQLQKSEIFKKENEDNE